MMENTGTAIHLTVSASLGMSKSYECELVVKRTVITLGLPSKTTLSCPLATVIKERKIHNSPYSIQISKKMRKKSYRAKE